MYVVCLDHFSYTHIIHTEGTMDTCSDARLHVGIYGQKDSKCYNHNFMTMEMGLISLTFECYLVLATVVWIMLERPPS